MSNVTSVRIVKVEPELQGLGLVLVTIIGIFFVIGGIFKPSFLLGSFGAVLAGIGIYVMLKLKPMYILVLGNAGGEAQALAMKDQEYIQSVSDAINQAIVERG
jgi:uncharacterized membrane protein